MPANFFHDFHFHVFITDQEQSGNQPGTDRPGLPPDPTPVRPECPSPHVDPRRTCLNTARCRSHAAGLVTDVNSYPTRPAVTLHRSAHRFARSALRITPGTVPGYPLSQGWLYPWPECPDRITDSGGSMFHPDGCFPPRPPPVCETGCILPCCAMDGKPVSHFP